MFYLCRWPNGDVSLVAGRNRREIDTVLDEIGNSDRAEMIPIESHAFALHFALKRGGEEAAGWITDLLQFQTTPLPSVSESLFESFNQAYPALSEVFASAAEPSTRQYSEEELAVLQDEYRNDVAAAREVERTRVEPKEVELSDDPAAAYFEHIKDFPKSLAEDLLKKPQMDLRQRASFFQRVRRKRPRS